MSNPDPAESSGPSVRFIPLTFQLIQKQLNKQEFWWGHAEILGLEALAGIWILQDLSKLLLIFCPQNFNMCWTNRLSASGCAPAIRSPHWIPNFTWSCWNKVGAPLLCCWFFIPSNVLPSSWWRGNLIPKLLEESMTTPPSVSESSKLFSDPKPNQTKPSCTSSAVQGKAEEQAQPLQSDPAPNQPWYSRFVQLSKAQLQPSHGWQEHEQPWSPGDVPDVLQHRLPAAHTAHSLFWLTIPPHLGRLWSFGLFCDCHSMSLWITKNVWVQLGATGWEATLKIWLQAANRVSVASKCKYRTRMFSGFSIKFILEQTTDLLYYENKLYLFMALNLHYPKYLIFVTSPLPPLQRKIWNTFMRLFGMILNNEEF